MWREAYDAENEKSEKLEKQWLLKYKSAREVTAILILYLPASTLYVERSYDPRENPAYGYSEEKAGWLKATSMKHQLESRRNTILNTWNEVKRNIEGSYWNTIIHRPSKRKLNVSMKYVKLYPSIWREKIHSKVMKQCVSLMKEKWLKREIFIYDISSIREMKHSLA